MSDGSNGLGEQYAQALEAYVAGLGEAALNQAYELGRKAYTDGLGVLDMAMVHHNALGIFAAQAASAGEQTRMERAAEFFAESLSPFEMSFRVWKRGFRIVEIPIIFVDRTEGVSKMSKKIVREAIWMVWRLRWWSLTGRI